MYTTGEFLRIGTGWDDLSVFKAQPAERISNTMTNMCRMRYLQSKALPSERLQIMGCRA
jgi:hypothetical protein